ncbi:hypothetical protein FOL47_005078 [Perkinsus chesapeaki]|uniref:Uncharacterized protein n=1 Tax=Perkinsus chesapeaki TaxID=330153 RepID=A0A7J6LZ15_PERCH|nr:hypothetical protein FOL47_005078 [Perkinsus chesapeaki]
MSITMTKLPLFIICFVSCTAIKKSTTTINNNNNNTQTTVNVLQEQEASSAKLSKAPVEEDYIFSEYGDGKFVKLPKSPFWRNVRIYKEEHPFFTPIGDEIHVDRLEKMKPSNNQVRDLLGRQLQLMDRNNYVDVGYYYMTENGDFAVYSGRGDDLEIFQDGWTLYKGGFYQYRGKGDYYLSPSGAMFKISNKKKRSGPYENPVTGATYLFNEELWVYYPESSKPDEKIRRPRGNNVGRRMPWMRNRF